MRQRTSSSVLTPSIGRMGDNDGSDSERSFTDFQAAQTEKSAMALLSIMRVWVAMWLPMFTSHILNKTLTAQGVLQALPRLLVWGVLCANRQYLQKTMTSHPIVVASGVQCIGHITVTYGMVSTSLHAPEGLMQHRVFLTQFLPMYLLAAANLYVPMQVFLKFVCPLYFTTWLIFHSSVGFLTPPAVMFILCLSAMSIYVQHYQTGVLWHEFQATRAVQKERNVSKAMQESFSRILSSIFDASCTCDKDGHISEFSPQLQELLGLPEWKACAGNASTNHEIARKLNLCSFAATRAEAARVQNFLVSASSGGCNQASKIQCTLRRTGSSSTGVVDVHLLAIALPDRALDQNEADSIFLVLEVQPSTSSREATQEDATIPTFNPSVISAGFEPPPHQVAGPLFSSLASIQNERSLPEELQSRVGMSDWVEGTLDDSLSYSISMRSANQQHLLTTREIATQTVTFPTANAWVQTAGSVGKPPLPASDESLQQPLPVRGLSEHLHRSLRREFSKKRYKMLRSYSATPRDVIREVIFINVMMCVNPICPRGCCIYHTLLNCLRLEVNSMMKQDCKNWDSDGKEQCAACFTLQDQDDDDQEPFRCGHCASDRVCEHQVSEMSSSSGSMDNNSG